MAKMLVIDDVEVTRFTVKQFAGDIGLEVLSASDEAEALSALRGNKVDVILLDWHLGKTSGIDLLKKIRTDFGAYIPVVVFSGVEGYLKSQEALSAGANAFLEKPTTREKLRDCLKNLGLAS